ncbi:hypothetical protein INR49_021738 [Caranx melampygus]|nr:hypothetical protein INR49_021738 [Caranx melampygus]
MWGHCVCRHLLAGCFPVAPSGPAPQSMRREQLCFVPAHLGFCSSTVFETNCCCGRIIPDRLDDVYILALSGFYRHHCNEDTVLICLGPSVPPAVSYTKRGQALSVESDHREEWDGARRLELNTSKGDVPASPLGVQERKKTTSAVGTNGSMTRRNTYVCERSSTERYSAIPNGKDSSLTEVSGSTPSTAMSSTRPRHTKSMSSSGHPSKSTLPPIDDNTELKASSSPRGPSTSPSAHSISTPEKNRFPRGTTSRSTFHGAQLRDRRSATYNGPPASPTLQTNSWMLLYVSELLKSSVFQVNPEKQTLQLTSFSSTKTQYLLLKSLAVLSLLSPVFVLRYKRKDQAN